MSQSESQLKNIENPTLGKHLVETLTMGMYTDPMVVYREYIQNAADQIDVAISQGIFKKRDEGLISISIDKAKRNIRIEDNATGIPKSQVETFLGDVAKSRKDPRRQKGFRGIGRLGGLGYCSRLSFETSAMGESTKSIIEMNAQRLRGIIKDVDDQSDAATVISLITTIREEPAESESHFFNVVLNEVVEDDEFSVLLDEKAVRDFLSMVAPVPFDSAFSYGDRIEAHFHAENFPLEEYSVKLQLDGNSIFKSYADRFSPKKKTEIGQIIGVDFFSIRGPNDDPLAIGWYGLTNLLNQAIPATNLVGGIRLKKNNITIGDENTLKKFWEADRFNLHFIGEVHVFDDEFIPNARRDDFNPSPTVTYLHDKLREEFKRLVKLSRFSSEVHSRYREIEGYLAEKRHFAEFRQRQPVSAAEVTAKETKLQASRKRAELAKNKLEDLDRRNAQLAGAQAVYKTIIDQEKLTFQSDELDLKPAVGEFRLDNVLSKLDPKVRTALIETFIVLDKELWFWETDRVERLKLRISETVVGAESK